MQTSVAQAVFGGEPRTLRPNRIGLIPGEGIGPELAEAAARVIDALRTASGESIQLDLGPALHRAEDGSLPLTDGLRDWYTRCRADAVPVLHGPAGGRFVYDLRRWADLFVKLTPVRTEAALADASLLRPERVQGADLLLVRDNSGGIYQGESTLDASGDAATHSFGYRRSQVAAVIDVAIRQAEQRRGHLTLVTKPGGIPAVSALWRNVALERADGRCELHILEIDNACYQLASDPRQFDVVVSPNMFGDVLGDTAAIALGSRGLSYSANFAADGFAVFQTAHGAAYDLAGRDVANPIGHLSSLAWLLELGLGRADTGTRLREAMRTVVARGIRTADIAGPDSTVVPTSRFVADVCDVIRGAAE